MNKTKKNIVIVGFPSFERKSIGVPPIGNILYVNDMKAAKKHQGYLIIINNINKESIVNFDKKYRKTLNKYVKVWLYHETYKYYKDKYSKIELYNRDIFYDISDYLWEEYDKYKESINIKNKITLKHLNKINELNEYLKKFDTIKTVKIEKDLQINKRTIQRYMQEINTIYHNVGYDYSKNEWYIII